MLHGVVYPDAFIIKCTRSDMKTMSLWAGSALLALSMLAGCATTSYDGASLVPGSTPAAEVEATMGAPADKVSVGADTLWWYPRHPGRLSYAVRVGADNIVKSVEQRLTEENLKHIQIGKTTSQDMRALMGPPYRVVRYPRRDGDSWEYKMMPGSLDDWMVLSVRFDAAGVVKEVTYVADSARICPNNCDDDLPVR
jgi:hypothetical protein